VAASALLCRNANISAHNRLQVLAAPASQDFLPICIVDGSSIGSDFTNRLSTTHLFLCRAGSEYRNATGHLLGTGLGVSSKTATSTKFSTRAPRLLLPNFSISWTYAEAVAKRARVNTLGLDLAFANRSLDISASP
jgi:hypothetical protein